MTAANTTLVLTDEARDTSEPLPPSVQGGAILVPAHATLDIALPAMPRTRRDMARLLQDHAPIAPEQIARTDAVPAAGETATVTVVRRGWLDDTIGRLERETGALLHARTADGAQAFRYRSPATKRAWSITLACWGAALIAFTAAGVSYFARVSEPRTEMVPGPVSPGSAEIPSGPGVAASILSMPYDGLPRDRLVAISGAQDGTVELQFDTQDPDELRREFAQEPALEGLAEGMQTQGRDGRFRVGYRSERAPIAPVASQVEADVLAAESRTEAIMAVRSRLGARTAGTGMQLAVLEPSGRAGEEPLQFDLEFSGSQGDVLAAVDAIESQAPPMRFGPWRLAPAKQGQPDTLRFSGTLTVPWTKRP